MSWRKHKTLFSPPTNTTWSVNNERRQLSRDRFWFTSHSVWNKNQAKGKRTESADSSADWARAKEIKVWKCPHINLSIVYESLGNLDFNTIVKNSPPDFFLIWNQTPVLAFVKPKGRRLTFFVKIKPKKKISWGHVWNCMHLEVVVD